MSALDSVTYENHNGVIIADSKNIVIDNIVIESAKKELDDVVQDFSKEAERLLKELEDNGKEIAELKEQIKVFCNSVKKKNPEKETCNALLSGIKATLANVSAVETLIKLGKKIVELL